MWWFNCYFLSSKPLNIWQMFTKSFSVCFRLAILALNSTPIGWLRCPVFFECVHQQLFIAFHSVQLLMVKDWEAVKSSLAASHPILHPRGLCACDCMIMQTVQSHNPQPSALTQHKRAAKPCFWLKRLFEWRGFDRSIVWFSDLMYI